MNRIRGLLSVIGVLVALLIAMFSYAFLVLVPRDEAFQKRRDMIRSDYCRSHGWETYTVRWSYSCVDKAGVERLIPDSVWDPLR